MTNPPFASTALAPVLLQPWLSGRVAADSSGIGAGASWTGPSNHNRSGGGLAP
jgi:hypothetical protein